MIGDRLVGSVGVRDHLGGGLGALEIRWASDIQPVFVHGVRADGLAVADQRGQEFEHVVGAPARIRDSSAPSKP